MYKLIKNNFTNEVNMVKRLSDDSFIPFDAQNSDYQQFLAWLEAGNTPQPADEPTA